MNRTGVPWRYLPHGYPHWNTVYAYFARWQEEAVFDQLNTLLRRQVRRQEGREEEPTACVIDSQTIKTSTNVPAAGQGIDAGKKIVGRKRSIVIDTVGLLLTALVTAASVQDSIAGQTLIERVATEHPTVRKTWVDGGFTSTPGLSWLLPLFPGPHEPADGTENEARFLDRSRTRSWTVDVPVS
ncbi:hypothetical protein Save01_07244 [Streptomyces avermitilis]|uniref:Uncharacterized protein n=1 Tax=Streptomyces avermitilis TaxID=33903 RepID=A0A4D4MBI6_STRAX|nr:hypothetical protein SAV14893_081800 [Streptomyces avermitilis]GDY70831.1 hypothetical protein SAV31267_003160 [Streptomyces avermitilis]